MGMADYMDSKDNEPGNWTPGPNDDYWCPDCKCKPCCCEDDEDE